MLCIIRPIHRLVYQSDRVLTLIAFFDNGFVTLCRLCSTDSALVSKKYLSSPTFTTSLAPC